MQLALLQPYCAVEQSLTHNTEGTQFIPDYQAFTRYARRLALRRAAPRAVPVSL